VVGLRLDLKYETLRFSNIWHYLLTGEVLNFEKSELKRANPRSPIDGVFLTAVIEQGGENFLYRGIVKDFWFDSRSGDLEGVQLMLADRRELSADTPDTSALETDPETDRREDSDDTPIARTDLDNRYHRIRGDFFVIKYPQAKNINLLYFRLKKKNNDDESSPKSGREIYRGTVKADTRDVLSTWKKRKDFRTLLHSLVITEESRISGKIDGVEYYLEIEYDFEVERVSS